MVNKNNSLNYSTANIFDSLKEEELPDNLLSPDSLIRKKRDTQRFNDMLCAAFIESMRIRNIIITHWKLQIEEAMEKLDTKIKSHLDIQLVSSRPIVIHPFQLSERQLDQIDFIGLKFRDLLYNIENKISLLNQKIQKQHSQINTLKQKRSQLNESFLQVWHHQIMTLPLPDPVHIPLNLPSPHYAIKDDYKKFIVLDGNEQKKILIEIGEDLQKKPDSILHLNDLILEKMLHYVRQILNENWSFLPKNQRELAIELTLTDPDTQRLLVYPLLTIVNKDVTLNNQIHTLCALNQDLARTLLKKNATMVYQDALVHHHDLLKKEYKQFKKQFIDLPNPVSTKNKNGKEVDDQLSAYDNHLDVYKHSLNENENIFYQVIPEINISSTTADDLLTDIDLFCDEVKQTKEHHQLSLLEKKQQKIDTRVQHFIHAMQKEHPDNNNIEVNKPAPNLKRF